MYLKKVSPIIYDYVDLFIYSASGRLGVGVDLPRLKQAELINTTLTVETVSLIICTVLDLYNQGEAVTVLMFVFSHCRGL